MSQGKSRTVQQKLLLDNCRHIDEQADEMSSVIKYNRQAARSTGKERKAKEQTHRDAKSVEKSKKSSVQSVNNFSLIIVQWFRTKPPHNRQEDQRTLENADLLLELSSRKIDDLLRSRVRIVRPLPKISRSSTKDHYCMRSR